MIKEKKKEKEREACKKGEKSLMRGKVRGRENVEERTGDQKMSKQLHEKLMNVGKLRKNKEEAGGVKNMLKM